MDYILMQWDYNRDPLALSETYQESYSLLLSAVDEFNVSVAEALAGPNGDALREYIGDEVADSYLEAEPTPPELMELLNRESALASLCLTSTDPDDTAGWYLELVDVRNEIARYYGYGDYVHYAYEMSYSRDYSPEDVDAVADIVAGYSDMYRDILGSVDSDDHYSTFTYTDPEELFDAVEPFIDSVCPEFAEAYDYMREYGLIDFEDLDTKLNMGYTQSYLYLTYIYCKPTLDGRDVTVLVHEFGHAANALLAERTLDYDIAEIHSHGMEALLALDPETVFGEDSTYEAFFLSRMVNMIAQGFAVDQFEKAVYSGQVDSREEMEALWNDLNAMFGIDEPRDLWTTTHLYSNPVYIISYAVSAFDALQIYLDGLEDRDAAVDEYLDVLEYSDTGYIGMTEALGMTDIFDRDDYSALMDALDARMDEVLTAGSPVPSLCAVA